MRVDVDTGAPRDEEARIARQYGQNGATPIINPSHPVCCLTILVQRSMWYRPSGLEPNEPRAVPVGVVRSEDRKVRGMLFLLYTVR